MGEPAIQTIGLRKAFGSTTVLRGVDLSVPAASLLALLGPNGSGKTTTVRILTTLLSADAGHARVAGHDVAREGASVRRKIGVAAQSATVDGLLTGRENLELFAGLHHVGRRAARRRAGELLERFGLTDTAERRVATYSGGLRRRLDLAVSMVAAPRILFLDEPTTGLDPRSRVELWATIEELRAAGTTILLTTQYLEEADQLAEQIAVIHDGRIVADDTPAVLKQRVGSERLVLTLATSDDVQRVGVLFDGMAGQGYTTGQPNSSSRDGSLHLDPGARQVMLGIQHPDQLRLTLDCLHRAGITVEAVDLHAPTLDDVFFELTRAAA